MSVEFVDYLLRITGEDNYARNKCIYTLRKGVGRDLGTVYEMDAYLGMWYPKSKHGRDVVCMVGALFGFHPVNSNTGDMGKHLRLVSLSNENGAAQNSLLKLIDADFIELWGRLCHSFRLIKKVGVPVNYEQLYLDLMSWNHFERYIQKRWSRSYWENVKQQEVNTEEKEND